MTDRERLPPERLSPEQRAVLLLPEVFGYRYPEAAAIVGKSADSLRQLASRTRRHLPQRRPRFQTTRQQQQELARRFFAAAEHGDLSGLEALLAHDVELTADGGGKVAALARSLRGRTRGHRLRGRVARVPGVSLRPMEVNGCSGALFGGALPAVARLLLPHDHKLRPRRRAAAPGVRRPGSRPVRSTSRFDFRRHRTFISAQGGAKRPQPSNKQRSGAQTLPGRHQHRRYRVRLEDDRRGRRSGRADRKRRRRIMQAPSEQMTAPALQALLKDGALAGQWVLDLRTSSVRLKSKIMGLIPVNGVFRQVSGHGSVFPDGEVSGTLTVAAASIDTSNTRRDTHLRSADFFDSGNHPDITFTADGVRPAGQGVAVTGALTVRGRTRPVSFDGTAAVHGDGEVGLDAQVHINRADFGLTWNVLGMVSLHNTLTIHAVFTRR